MHSETLWSNASNRNKIEQKRRMSSHCCCQTQSRLYFWPMHVAWNYLLQCCFLPSVHLTISVARPSCVFFSLNTHLHLSSSGWILGERLHDGERGWFPNRVVEQIMSAEVRAQNLKECQRIQQAQEGAQGARAASRGRRPVKNSQYSPTWTDL